MPHHFRMVPSTLSTLKGSNCSANSCPICIALLLPALAEEEFEFSFFFSSGSSILSIVDT